MSLRQVIIFKMEIKMEAENRNRSGWFDKNSSKEAKDEESVNMFELMNKVSQQQLKAKSKPSKRGASSDRESDYDRPSKVDPVKKKSTKKGTKPKPPKRLPESDEESIYDRFPKKEEEMFKESKNKVKKSKPKKSGTDSTEVDENKTLKPSMRKVKKRPGLKSADQKDDEWVNMYDVLDRTLNPKPNRRLEENEGESTPVKTKPKKKEKKPKPPKSVIESAEESDYDTGTVSKSDSVNKPPKKKEKKPKSKPVSSDSGEESNTYDLDEREPPVKKKPKKKGKKTPVYTSTDSDGGAGSEWVNMHDLMNRIAQQKLEPKSKPRSRAPDSGGKSGAVTPSKIYPVSKKEKKDKKPKSKNVSSDSGEESEPISKKSKKKGKKPKSKNVSDDSGDESDNIGRGKSGKKPSEPPVAYSYAIVPPDQRKEAAPISIATRQSSKPPSKQPSDSLNKKTKKKGTKSKTEEKPKPKRIESSSASDSDSAGLNKSDMLSQKPRTIENESPVASRSYMDYFNQYCYDGGGNVQTRPPQQKCPRHKLNDRPSVRDQGNQQSCDDLFEALNKKQPIERVEYTGGNYNQDVFNQGNVFMKKPMKQERKIPSQAFRGGGKDDQAVSMLDLLSQAVKSSQEMTPKPKTLTNDIFDADSGKGDSLSNKSKRSKKQLPVETDSGEENEDFELSQNVSVGQQSRRSQKAPSSVSSKNSKISKKSAKSSKGLENPEESEKDPCKTTGATFLRFIECLGTNKYMCERITEDCQPVDRDVSAPFYCGDSEECCEPVKFEDMFGLSFPHFTVAIVVILCGAALYRHLYNCYFVVVVVFSIIIFTAYKKYAKRFKGQN